MNTRALVLTTAALLFAQGALAQQTPTSMVKSYDALADAILAVRQAEAAFVRALLDGHRHAAEAQMKRGKHEAAAAEIAIFANEGDNAIGGVRKRLLEGGHHANPEGEEQGIFEDGFVIVTKEAKKKCLAASAALRKATTDEARDQAWQDFVKVADMLLAHE